MAKVYSQVDRTFIITEIECMAQTRSGECLREKVQLRGTVRSDARAEELAAAALNTSDKRVTFCVNKKFLKVSFTMPDEVYIKYATETGREEIKPDKEEI